MAGVVRDGRQSATLLLPFSKSSPPATFPRDAGSFRLSAVRGMMVSTPSQGPNARLEVTTALVGTYGTGIRAEATEILRATMMAALVRSSFRTWAGFLEESAMVVGASLRMSGYEVTTMSGLDRFLHRSDRAEAPYHGTAVAEMVFRDERSLAADLQRLESHYRGEAARLKADAEDAQKAARACRQWRHDLAEGEAP